MEKLCGSIGASFALLYAIFGAIYHLSPVGETPPKALALVSVASVGLGIAARRDLARLFGSFRVRQAVAGFFFLLAWTLVILGMIRNYSGADWYGDWIEQFQRSLFFAHHFPAANPIILGYEFPARPPAMNELAAFFMGQAGDRFEIFQLIFSFLNLLAFLPCCLIMPALRAGGRQGAGRRGVRIGIPALVALFALNPVVMQNVTYTWTKAFTAFYVILGLSFYLAACRKNDSLRMIVAFLALSMGLLVHYSTAPYLVFVTLHYLLRVFPKRSRRWQEAVTIAAVCGLMLGTWFGWSLGVYGTRATLASNTSVVSSQQYQGNNLAKIGANVVDSIVPVVLRNPSLLGYFKQQGFLGSIRDDAFIFYQANLVFSMGLIGGPLILWLLYRVFSRRSEPVSERSFWLAMIPFCVIVGIASTGERGPLGKAHLTLLSIEILGLSLLATAFPLRRALLALVVAGCLIDFSFGILLHAHVESLENTPQRAIFAGLAVMSGNQPNPVRAQDSLSGPAWNNWILKHQYAQLVELSQSSYLDAAFGRTQMRKALRDDDVYWHGWYARNNYTVGFLADHSAGETGIGTTVLAWLLVALAVGLAGLLAQISTTTALNKDRGLVPLRGAAYTGSAGK